MDGATYTITVTSEHIQRGRQCDPCGCPVKLALEAAGFTGVRVANHVMWARDPGGWEVIADPLPREAAAAIYQFDIHKEMVPFAFTMQTHRFPRTRAAVNAGVAA